jgi:hypothetical protein
MVSANLAYEGGRVEREDDAIGMASGEMELMSGGSGVRARASLMLS